MCTCIVIGRGGLSLWTSDLTRVSTTDPKEVDRGGFSKSLGTTTGDSALALYTGRALPVQTAYSFPADAVHFGRLVRAVRLLCWRRHTIASPIHQVECCELFIGR